MTLQKKVLVGTIGFVFVAALGGMVIPKIVTSATAQQQRFTGRENHTVPLSAASAMTRSFRRTVSPGTVIGGFFGRDAIQSILSQSGCVGIRAYYAYDEGNSPTLVLVGVNESGDDMTGGVMLERWFPCPPFCPQDNELTK